MSRFVAVAVALLGTAPAWADEAAPTGALGGLMNMVPFVLMFAVFYFMMIRPAQAQRVRQEERLAALKKDDEVVTQSGLIGRIISLEDQTVLLELGDRVRVRMLRDRISGPWQAGANSAATRPGTLRAGSAS